MIFLPYCRMEETYEALKDVLENWDKPTTDREVLFRLRILDLCKQIAARYQEEPTEPTTSESVVEITDVLDEINGEISSRQSAEILARLLNFRHITATDYDELEMIIKKHSR